MTPTFFNVALGLLLALGAAVHLLQRRNNARLRTQLEAAIADLEHLQQACSRLAPAGVVQRLLTDKSASGNSPVAERKTATALFVDIAGYTKLSEQLEPDALADLLNRYFQLVSVAVCENNGLVSTFVGDGALAFWGMTRSNPWQSRDAVSAALAMRAAIRDYNVERAREGLPQLAIGIGIHRGPGLAALIGSRERMEYLFVGRTVNWAARVQSLTRVHQVDILITETVRAELDSSFALEAMPPETVKGIAGPVITYAVREKTVTAAPFERSA